MACCSRPSTGPTVSNQTSGRNRCCRLHSGEPSQSYYSLPALEMYGAASGFAECGILT